MANKSSTFLADINSLFVHYLVGKTQINKDNDYNDGLYQQDNGDEVINGNGWHQRILLDVEKERVQRLRVKKQLEKKRTALLTRYFQQRLLSTIDDQLNDTETLLSEQLQMRDNSLQLLIELLENEASYFPLAELLDLNPSIRKQVINLVANDDFMALLGKDKYLVQDAKSAIGMIGTDVLRYLIPSLIFKYRINSFNAHNRFFAKKLWRYQLTLGQTCTSLMQQAGYSKPFEGQLLSAMCNFAYAACFEQYRESFEAVRVNCIAETREKGEKIKHDFFFELKSDPASLQALLIAKSDLKMSVELAQKAFPKAFPHLRKALEEEVENVDFDSRSMVGKILHQATSFAKYEQLRAARLFKAEWLDSYLTIAQIDSDTFKHLLRQELFRFKSDWS